jgi:hypothetical protein
MSQPENNSSDSRQSENNTQLSTKLNDDGKLIPPDDGMLLENSSNGSRILYITFSAIVGLILLWIFIVVYTKDDTITILKEMTDLAAQIVPISDNK